MVCRFFGLGKVIPAKIDKGKTGNEQLKDIEVQLELALHRIDLGIAGGPSDNSLVCVIYTTNAPRASNQKNWLEVGRTEILYDSSSGSPRFCEKVLVKIQGITNMKVVIKLFNTVSKPGFESEARFNTMVAKTKKQRERERRRNERGHIYGSVFCLPF